MAKVLDKVRDPSHATGERDSDEAYHLHRMKFYPDIETEVYRIPPLYLGREAVVGKVKKKTKYGKVEYDVQQIDQTHLLGDAADMRVADSIEELLGEDLLEEKEPALILTDYDLTQHRMKSGDTNKDIIIRGDHDVAIIHKKYGNIFIQVKSARSNLNDPICNAKKQAKKDTEFFTKLCGDGVKTTQCISTIAFPGVTKAELAGHFQRDDPILPLVLCGDNLPNEDTKKDNLEKKRKLKEWWNAIKDTVMQKRSGSAVYTMDEYKFVFERYVGEKSTVSARSFGQSIALVGNRCEKIQLTPPQKAILDSNNTRCIIRGGYGTGKTLLLILKCRELIIRNEQVAIISMAKSPLKKVLKASITHDLKGEFTQNLTCVTAKSQGDLMNKLKLMADEKRHVFIDEFPSVMFKDLSPDRDNVLCNYPVECMLWCVMAREREEKLSRGVRDIFPENFEDVVFKDVLRCPPVISTIYTTDRYTTIVSYKKGHLNDKGGVAMKRLAEYFYSSGIYSNKIKQIVENKGEKPNFKWHALKVLDESKATNGPVHSLLEELGVPLTASAKKDAVQYTCDIWKHFPDSRMVFDGPSFIMRLSKADTRDIPKLKGKLKDDRSVLIKLFKSLGLTTEQIEKEIKEKGYQTTKSPSVFKWSDIILIEKPETYVFLENLDILLSTETESQNRAHFGNTDDSTNNQFVLRFDGERITVRHPILVTGPHIRRIEHINHDHGSLDDCETCQGELKSIFRQCDLDKEQTDKKEIPDASPVRQSEEDLIESGLNLFAVSGDPNLNWSDVVILDDRPKECKSAKEFFKKCVPHLIDERDCDRVEDENKDVSYGDRVLYTKPELFQGMERKVVVVLEKTPLRFRNPVVDGIIRDYTELAISRCSSLLIVMKSDE